MIKTIEEGEPFRCAGNAYRMLVPREIGGCCELVYERIEPGHVTPPNQHETFLQIYVLLRGHAKVTVGSETRVVEAPAVCFIPPKTNHFVENLSAETAVEYLYTSVWPDGIPFDEREGGWREVYRKITQAYADRGYGERT
jgi:quercetin dioxygenase-like cupin family protein